MYIRCIEYEMVCEFYRTFNDGGEHSWQVHNVIIKRRWLNVSKQSNGVKHRISSRISDETCQWQRRTEKKSVIDFSILSGIYRIEAYDPILISNQNLISRIFMAFSKQH